MRQVVLGAALTVVMIVGYLLVGMKEAIDVQDRR